MAGGWAGRVWRAGRQAPLPTLTREASKPWSCFQAVGAPRLVPWTRLQGAWCPAYVLLDRPRGRGAPLCLRYMDGGPGYLEQPPHSNLTAVSQEWSPRQLEGEGTEAGWAQDVARGEEGQLECGGHRHQPRRPREIGILVLLPPLPSCVSSASHFTSRSLFPALYIRGNETAFPGMS